MRFVVNTDYSRRIKMIHYLSIFDEGKNLGTTINKAIERLNCLEDDWIVLRDLDVAFLTPDAGSMIIEATKSGYDLIGCTMNRLAETHQVSGDFEQSDIFEHYYLAKQHQYKYGYKVIPFKHDLAAAVMIFSFKIWKRVKFKNNIVFDREFTKGVRINGGKVGIMPGLYVFHAYRLWAKTRNEARNSIEHLIKK